LSIAAQILPELSVARELLSSSTSPATPTEVTSWDAALSQTQLSELLSPSLSTAQSQQVSLGLVQLNKYLGRAWYRAGIPEQLHDDCTQAVYVTLLQNLGRERFDSLLEEISQHGIRDVLSRETVEGPDFFRAVDTVKKRAQRERTYQPLDTIASTASAAQDETQARRRGALKEAIDQTLSPREAALIYATLKGETPAEIASQWGVASKTVSNEKTRVLQKLREVLADDSLN
jgi:RNA polymerase sigma factor (sigma-70 family)